MFSPACIAFPVPVGLDGGQNDVAAKTALETRKVVAVLHSVCTYMGTVVWFDGRIRSAIANLIPDDMSYRYVTETIVDELQK